MNRTAPIITRLERERRARGWTQIQLAALLGASGPSVSLWESGRRRPTGQRVTELERTFGLDVDTLLSADATVPHRTAA